MPFHPKPPTSSGSPEIVGAPDIGAVKLKGSLRMRSLSESPRATCQEPFSTRVACHIFLFRSRRLLCSGGLLPKHHLFGLPRQRSATLPRCLIDLRGDVGRTALVRVVGDQQPGLAGPSFSVAAPPVRFAHCILAGSDRGDVQDLPGLSSPLSPTFGRRLPTTHGLLKALQSPAHAEGWHVEVHLHPGGSQRSQTAAGSQGP